MNDTTVERALQLVAEQTRAARRERDRRHALNRRRRAVHRLTGVDGEGWTDHDGHHHYMLLVAGERSLHTGRPLTGEQCLDFLAALPKQSGVRYLGFFFDYDVTMILRDIVRDDPELAKKLFEEADGIDAVIKWRRWEIAYRPSRHLKVRRRESFGPGSWTTIHDVRGFFQCSFLKAITDFNVGTLEERQLIEKMKAERPSFDITQIEEITEYCRLECRLLAELCQELKARFAHAELSPSPYEGPGPVAGRALRGHVNTSYQNVPIRVIDFAKRAYYGGRFEITALGRVKNPVWGYDIRSAYPAAMLQLPCLQHGQWVPGVESELYVAHVSWNMPGAGAKTMDKLLWKALGPLPHRIKETGAILYPEAGEGWYWSHEIPSYATIHTSYSYIKTCDCQPFQWVNELYQRRQEMEAQQKGSGIALKLTLNSLYGKMAQRVGKAPYYNPIWAGLITSVTRAKIYRVYLDHPGKVVMFATDAVFLTEQAPELTIGSALGNWEIENGEKPYENCVLIRPGVYYDSGEVKFKTRGIPRKQFQEHADEFWWLANAYDSDNPQKFLNIPRENHLSLRQGLAWGQNWYDRIGDWITRDRQYTCDPMPKRLRPIMVEDDDFTSWTAPPPNLGKPTTPYDKELPAWKEVEDDAYRWDEGAYDGEND